MEETVYSGEGKKRMSHMISNGRGPGFYKWNLRIPGSRLCLAESFLSFFFFLVHVWEFGPKTQDYRSGRLGREVLGLLPLPTMAAHSCTRLHGALCPTGTWCCQWFSLVSCDLVPGSHCSVPPDFLSPVPGCDVPREAIMTQDETRTTGSATSKGRGLWGRLTLHSVM